MTKKKIKASTALRRAWKLIANKKHWTTGAYARTKHGRECEPGNKAAMQFCAYGALLHAGASDQAEDYLRAVEPCVIDLNDTRGHAAVRELYAKAIRLAVADERKAAK